MTLTYFDAEGKMQEIEVDCITFTTDTRGRIVAEIEASESEPFEMPEPLEVSRIVSIQ